MSVYGISWSVCAAKAIVVSTVVSYKHIQAPIQKCNQSWRYQLYCFATCLWISRINEVLLGRQNIVQNISNPNTSWELIKGTIRNELIKYASRRKREKEREAAIYTSIYTHKWYKTLCFSIQIHIKNTSW